MLTHPGPAPGGYPCSYPLCPHQVPEIPFDYTLGFHTVNFRQHPELYRVGRGKQGELLVQPYKGEILPHWRSKDVVAAMASSLTIRDLLRAYLQAEDFVGADVARKFLQMGFTRARCYANYRGGKKYAGPVPANKGQSGLHEHAKLPRTTAPDPDKIAAEIFGWE